MDVLVKLYAAPWQALQAAAAIALRAASQLPLATPSSCDSMTSEEVALQAAEAL